MAQNFDLTQTGPELQAVLDQVAVNTQGIVTEAGYRVDGDDDLQQQINEIISDDTVVKLTASPTAVFVGVETEIALTATTTTEASSITISGGNIETPATGSGTRLAATDTITAEGPGTTTYAASFVVAGITKNAPSVNVAAVYPIYYGAAADIADVTYTQLATPRTTPVGATFQLTTTAGQYIFFKVPSNMTQPTHLYLVGSFDTPMGFAQVAQEDGYIIYKNNEARGAGTFTYKLG